MIKPQTANGNSYTTLSLLPQTKAFPKDPTLKKVNLSLKLSTMISAELSAAPRGNN
jgi:hypothetical protein